MHATILAHLFSLVETSKVSEPLFTTEGTQYPSNQVGVFISATVKSQQAACPNLSYAGKFPRMEVFPFKLSHSSSPLPTLQRRHEDK